MQHTLSDTWTRRGLIIVAILAGLAALSVSLIPSTSAQQGLPEIPHWFWGTDAHTYAGDRVYALDQNGIRLASTAGEDHPVVDAQGGWAYVISTDEASRVTFRIETRDGTLETNPYTVVGNGEDTEISIRDFTREVSATLPVEIRARVYPSSQNPSIPFRSIEFNLRADGVTQALSNNPRERTIRPNHASGRWYRSNWFELGDGFRAAIIACKDQNGGVRFGVRVDGRDDVIPRLNLLPASRTTTRWAVSNVVQIMQPGDDANPSRAGRGDDNCRFGKDN